MRRPMYMPPTRRRIVLEAAAALVLAASVVGCVQWTAHTLRTSPAPTSTQPPVILGPCYASLADARAVGDQEDSTCAVWYRGQVLVEGPAWAMEPGDVEVTP